MDFLRSKKEAGGGGVLFCRSVRNTTKRDCRKKRNAAGIVRADEFAEKQIERIIALGRTPV
jgi:hypothetical protein